MCNGELSYGQTVRVKQEIDLRRFPSMPRATKQFERLYKGRTAVERVNARLKLFWGIDDGQVNGARRFHAHVGAVMVVRLAFATLLAQLRRKLRHDETVADRQGSAPTVQSSKPADEQLAAV